MKEQILNQVDVLQDDLIKNIQEFVRIPSVMSSAVDGCPFGKNIDNALRSMLKLCDKLGFRTVYKDGYYGYAEIGSGDEMIGILGHLDVVHEGDLKSWKFGPYDATIKDGKLYGRGSQDNKGPLIGTIYAVKALLDIGVNFNKRIRFIFGTDEENLWRCINKYKENNEEIPTFGFTPDSLFPVINAEKGLMQIELSCESKNKKLKINVGDSVNAVPGVASYTGEFVESLKSELDELGFEYESKSSELHIIGRGVHSASCDLGINALSRLCIALCNIGVNSNTIRFIAEIIGEDVYGKNIVDNCEDEVSGKLTVNLGKLVIDDKTERAFFDIRIPVTFDKNKISESLLNLANKYKLNYNEYDYLDSLHVQRDSKLVKTLREVYESETGLDGTPLSSGGATYARALDNCVAFGSIFPGSPETEHQADEYLLIEDLMKASKIYALAIYKLLSIQL